MKTFLGKVYNKLKENDTTGINETLKQKQSYQSEKAIIDTPFEDTTKVKEKKIPVQVVSKDWTTGYVNPIQQNIYLSRMVKISFITNEDDRDIW